MSSSTGHKRLSGYKEALKEHRIEFAESLIFQGKSSLTSGYEATIQLIDSGVPFTAIFACADSMAIGAIRALLDRGIKVPDEVSVIGIDGDPVGDYMVPRLSTVALPILELTRAAITTALTYRQQQSDKKHFQYHGSLQVKESTRKLS